MTLADTALAPAQPRVDPELRARLARIDELRNAGAIDTQTAFGMLFFHGIETGVKCACSRPGARAAYNAVKDTLRLRTLTRGHAHAHSIVPGNATPVLDEQAWSDRGLTLDPASVTGFVGLLEASAQTASEATGLEAVPALQRALLDFVQMRTSVTGGPTANGSAREQLGGFPDSAHFFSFAELSFCKLATDPISPFWLELGRGAVAAQPIYLALQFLAGRRAPRSITDYGPWDLLGHPDEVERRLALAPEPEDLSGASGADLARLAGRNAHRGFLG